MKESEWIKWVLGAALAVITLMLSVIGTFPSEKIVDAKIAVVQTQATISTKMIEKRLDRIESKIDSLTEWQRQRR